MFSASTMTIVKHKTCFEHCSEAQIDACRAALARSDQSYALRCAHWPPLGPNGLAGLLRPLPQPKPRPRGEPSQACGVCGKVKPAREFYSKRSGYGRRKRSFCRACEDLTARARQRLRDQRARSKDK